jgi:hypothetical protein
MEIGMTPEYEEQIKKYVEFALDKGLAAIQDHLMEHYADDGLAQNVAMDAFWEAVDALQCGV